MKQTQEAPEILDLLSKRQRCPQGTEAGELALGGWARKEQGSPMAMRGSLGRSPQ